MRFVLFSTFFFVLSTISYATTFINRPLGDVVKETPNIIRGRTGESYSGWDKTGRKALYTYTTLSVVEVLKGGLKENEILIRQPGGSKDGIEMSVPGTANFKSGEEVVVMLGDHNAEDDSYDVPGFTTGKYNVVAGENGELSLVSSLGGAAMYDPQKDINTLSYNSRIPLNVFRKMAKGEEVPEAANTQFKQSEKPAPKTAYDADHHAHAPPAPVVSASAAPQQNSAHESEVAPPAEKIRFWIPLSFLLISMIGIWLILKILRPKA